MKKVYVGGFFIALVIVGAFVLATNNKEASAPSNASETATTSETQETAQISSGGSGQYIDYAEYQSSKKDPDSQTLLFFHAPWCPQCRSIEEDINKQGVPSGVTIVKVDYDTNQELRKKYGVTQQTTFVKIDADQNKVQSFVAYDEPTLDSVQRELL